MGEAKIHSLHVRMRIKQEKLPNTEKLFLLLSNTPNPSPLKIEQKNLPENLPVKECLVASAKNKLER